jgi:hypothetical protein
MNNIAKSFAGYMQDTLALGTEGNDIRIGHAPSDEKAPDALWWIKTSGGNKIARLTTGESVKNYNISIYRRNHDYQALYNEMQSLEEQMNTASLIPNLTGYVVLRAEATNFPIDDDLDAEDRKIGLLQITIQVYKPNQ